MPLAYPGEAFDEGKVEAEGEVACEVEECLLFLSGVDVPRDVAIDEHLLGHDGGALGVCDDVGCVGVYGCEVSLGVDVDGVDAVAADGVEL